MQLKQLFTFSGSVNSCSFVGEEDKFAFVEYATPGVILLITDCSEPNAFSTTQYNQGEERPQHAPGSDLLT